MKPSVIIWISISALLLLFPVWFIVYYVIKYYKKSRELVVKKVAEIKELDAMRNDILDERKRENEESDSSELQEQEVTDDLLEKKDKVMEVAVPTKESSSEESVQENDLSDAIPVETKQKMIAEKQKKLLEKIKYEALVAKEKWKIDEFEKKLVEGLAIDPENIDFQELLADLYFTLGHYKKSLSLLKKVIDNDPQDHKAIRQIWEIYLSKWEFHTAELLVEKAIAIKPSNPKYHISMVEILYNTHRKQDAAEVLEKVVKLRPANVSYLLALADLYAEIDDVDNARKYYYRVLEYEPSHIKAKNKLQTL